MCCDKVSFSTKECNGVSDETSSVYLISTEHKLPKEVCLMMRRSCNIIVVEEKVPIKFVTVQIYTDFFAGRKLKITVLVKGDSGHNPVTDMTGIML